MTAMVIKRELAVAALDARLRALKQLGTVLDHLLDQPALHPHRGEVDRELRDVGHGSGLVGLGGEIGIGEFARIGLMLQEHSGWDEAKIRARACECLAMVGLEGAEDKAPSELSGGMKKRAGLARAIVMEPEYILYDEPTTGLDPITSDAINDLIIKLQKQLGVTSIVVTHDMPSAFKIADRIAMLSRGRIVFSGTVDEVRTTDHPMVRQFIEGNSQGPLGSF